MESEILEVLNQINSSIEIGIMGLVVIVILLIIR